MRIIRFNKVPQSESIKKNFGAILFGALVGLIFAELISSIYLNFFFWDGQYLTSEEITFTETYQKEVNHLRHPSILWNYDSERKLTNLLYHEFNPDGFPAIGIFGDSWAEKFITSKVSLESLEYFADHYNVHLVVGGTSSYSPSLTTVQMRILREQFNIELQSAAVVIDNTDIGDELCRYAGLRYFGPSNRLKIRPFGAGDHSAVYDSRLMLEVYKIRNSSRPYIIQVYLIAKTRIKYQKDERNVRCKWDQIAEPLRRGITDVEKDLFVERLLEMERETKKFRDFRGLYFITVPHRGHLTGKYSFGVASLIREFQEHASSTVVHSDLSPEIITAMEEHGYKLEDVYVRGDPASHLTDRMHNEMLVPLVEGIIIESRAAFD